MRYTTIIDISASQTLYKSKSVRLVYLHLVLRSGYHDNDRDLVNISLRRLAEDVGITLAATRHALKQLEQLKMIQRNGSVIWVRKWVMEQTITKRAKTNQQQKQIDAVAARKRQEEQLDKHLQAEQNYRDQQAAQGKDGFMLWYEEQQRKAAAGDIEAQRTVERKRKDYEGHQAKMKELAKSETK